MSMPSPVTQKDALWFLATPWTSERPSISKSAMPKRSRRMDTHVKLIEIDAQGRLDHAATQYVIPSAGACLNGLPDDRLVSANNTMSRAFAAEEVSKSGPLTGSLALINGSLRAAKSQIPSRTDQSTRETPRPRRN